MSQVNQRLNGLNPLSYLGVDAPQPTNFITANRNPTSNDSKNFNLGTWWLNTANNDLYYLASLSGLIATWLPVAGATGAVTSLTGNSGGAVLPSGGNINVVGDGTTINIVGNPGTHTLTASTTGIIADSFVTNSGTATPALGVLNILGGTGITTSASGSTVTITNLESTSSFDSITMQVFTSSGTYTPTTGMKYCIIEVVGGGGGGGATPSNAGGIAAGGGGAGGGYSRGVFTAATIGASKTVTIGAGGAGGALGNNDGSSGGTTSVGALIQATGGNGGAHGATQTTASTGAGGATPGIGSVGSVNASGSVGLNGIAMIAGTTYFCYPGVGGSSVLGGGGPASIAAGSTAGAAQAAGSNGNAYGSGGSGALCANGGTGGAGGNGSAGVVVVTEFLTV